MIDGTLGTRRPSMQGEEVSLSLRKLPQICMKQKFSESNRRAFLSPAPKTATSELQTICLLNLSLPKQSQNGNPVPLHIISIYDFDQKRNHLSSISRQYFTKKPFPAQLLFMTLLLDQVFRYDLVDLVNLLLRGSIQVLPRVGIHEIRPCLLIYVLPRHGKIILRLLHQP